MATPINKDILDKIEARLEALKLAANGYFQGVKKISRASLTPFKPQDLPTLNFWPTGVDNSLTTYGSDNREITLTVEAHTKTRDRPFTDVADELAADIITALNRDPLFPKLSDDPSLDLGGAVDSFDLDGYDYQIGQGGNPYCGVVVSFTVKFTTDNSNMII